MSTTASIELQPFTHEGTRYIPQGDGSFLPEITGGTSNTGCTCKTSTTAAAGSLESAASQTDFDALATKVEGLERMFTRLEGDRLTAEDVDMDNAA